VGLRGSLALSDTGGKLVMPGMTSEYAEHPVERAAGTLRFEPGRLAFDGVQVRGPKGNLDGSGVWTAEGPVSGSGKAWFSKSYTTKLVPAGFGWLAGLFGLKEIRSDWSVSGTSDRVTLNTGITKSVLWKLAKGRVPKDFQTIASGKTPLWVAPAQPEQVKTASAQ
jgi:hypothetical protein